MSDPFQVVRDFEKALCEYTGSRFAVTTNSCTMALLLAVAWYVRNGGDQEINIPKRTYVSVPMSILHAGGRATFRDEDWLGSYRLTPSPVWDCARTFTAGMYEPDTFQCVSFHHSKILGDTQGGAILHDNEDADGWLRKARFDGRTEGVFPKDDTFMLGWHCYISPDVAARLLWKMDKLPEHNDPLPNDDYPDISKSVIFK